MTGPQPQSPAPPAIRDAATVIVVDRTDPRGASVLMGQRGASAAFMPSKYVFPGGAVDAEDADAGLARPLRPDTHARLAAEPRGDGPVAPQTLAAAALRELAEETGLLTGQPGPAPAGWDHYANAGLAPDASALIYVFRAITPPGRTRRFDARFFIAEASDVAGRDDDFGNAGDELRHLQWLDLAAARHEVQQGLRRRHPWVPEVAPGAVLQVIGHAQNFRARVLRVDGRPHDRKPLLARRGAGWAFPLLTVGVPDEPGLGVGLEVKVGAHGREAEAGAARHPGAQGWQRYDH